MSSSIRRYDDSVFKDDRGRWRTTSLFREWQVAASKEAFPPLFSIKDEDYTDTDGRVFPSLKKLYMSFDHVPGFEWEFAVENLGSWAHWQRMQQNVMIKALVNEWRSEYEIALRCRAVKGIIKASRDESPSGVASCRWLADKGYAVARPGRVSKEELARERTIAAGVNETLKNDMERLGLSVVSNVA